MGRVPLAEAVEREEKMSLPSSTGKSWYWRVTFRNDKMGFQKTYKIIADTVLDAIEEAVQALHEQGYDSANFNVMAADRSREVGQ
jgi:hypothetical protein